MTFQIAFWAMIDGLKATVQVAGVFVALSLAAAFLRISYLEHRMRTVHKKRDDEILKARSNNDLSQPKLDALIEHFRKKCEEEIEPLERERRFILGKIPFLKQ